MTARSSGIEVPPDALASIRGLYEAGLYLRAYERAQPFVPLDRWCGTAARVLAGRLALNLGAVRLGFGLHRRAWRLDRADPDAVLYCAYAMLARGPLRAWAFMRDKDLAATTSPDRRADWQALRAAVAAQLRDFDVAEEDLARAKELSPLSPWIAVQEAHVLELQDRYGEALEAARRSLELRAFFRPGVEMVAWLLLLGGRLEEARDLLAGADRRIECGEVAALLASVQMQLEDFGGAEASVTRYERLMPLAERGIRERIAALRADLAYRRGDLASAADLARLANDPFHLALAERLGSVGGGEGRVRLPVPFVRQHHLTCSPATLSALSSHWSRPVDHLALAREITYDGTPGHKARTWFAANGWVAREFRVTWKASIALLDRGVPFTLVTVAATSAHEQAVVGYDERRGTWLIRDPSHPLLMEAVAEKLLARQQDSGPRGFVIVPQERGSLLEGIDLPDADLYDRLHRIEAALARYDRASAVADHRALAATDPDHRLSLEAARHLANYDMDPRAGLEWADAMLRLHPKSGAARRARVAALSQLGRHRERLDELATLAADRTSDPVFLGLYAGELGVDSRLESRALDLLRRALRSRPHDAELISTWATILWRARRFEEALPLYRFAACLEDTNETRATAYFTVTRPLGRADEALAFLRRREERFGEASSRPMRTLFWVLEELGRAHEGFEHLERALARRPHDGELMLLAAGAHARYGRVERATALLEQARGRTREADWARAAADLRAHEADLEGALRRWLEVVETEPLAMDAHEEAARLLASTRGAPAAVEHLRSAAGRYPHHYSLHVLLYRWVREEEGLEKAEEVLRHVLEVHPVDAWAHRELALLLAEVKRLDDARAHVEIAGELEPLSPSWHFVRGSILADAGRPDEAAEAYREAVRIDVGHQASVAALVDLLHAPEARREALRFVHGEILRQPQVGDGLGTYRQMARSALPPEELLLSLRRVLDDRPDQWPAWTATVEQLDEMGRFDEAVRTGSEAAARFPLVHQVWLALAEAHRLAGEGPLERAALEKAQEIQAGRAPAARRLATIHEERGDFAEARLLLEEVLARDPLDALTHVAMGELQWRAGEREEALRTLERALALEPGYRSAWDLLAAWCAAQGRPDSAVRVARALTARRPGEARSWMVLARMLQRPEEREECMAAVEKAISLNPRWIELHDLRAMLLVEEHRFEEALAACRPAVWGDTPPCALSGRAAWVEAQRGNLAGAIERMRAVVAREPGYEWGWVQLVEWHMTAGAHEEALEAASRLVDLAPDNAEAYGWRGHARRQLGKAREAREDFQRALELDPRYAYAKTSLVELQIEQANFEAAAATLSRYRSPSPDETDLALEARIAAARREGAAAGAALRLLLGRPAVDAQVLQAALTAFVEAGWHGLVEEAAGEALAQGGGPPELGPVWMGLLARRPLDAKRCERFLRRLAPGTESRRRALLVYAQALGDQRRTWRLRLLLWRHGDEIRAHDELWGTAGYALLVAGRPRAVRRWLSDWRERSGVRPWMLFNLAWAESRVSGWRAGLGLHEEALRLPPDHTSALHGLRVAFAEALAGGLERARSLSAVAHPGPEDGESRLLKALTEAMLALERGERDFGWFKGELVRARDQHATSGALGVRYLHACAWRMARRHGGFGSALWAVFQ